MKIKNPFVTYQEQRHSKASKILTAINSHIVTNDNLSTIKYQIDIYFDYKIYVDFLDVNVYLNFDNISNIIYDKELLTDSGYFHILLLINDISEPYTESFSESSRRHRFHINKTDFNQLMRSFKLHQIKKL